MPTRPTKGDHGHADRGSEERGGQKAAFGSALDPKAAAFLRARLADPDAEVSGEEVGAPRGPERGHLPLGPADDEP
jgi:hypothetical protein